jgi:hypothetical protein
VRTRKSSEITPRLNSYKKCFIQPGHYVKLRLKFELLDKFTDSELVKSNGGKEIRGMTIDEWEYLPATRAHEKRREFEAKRLKNSKMRGSGKYRQTQ